MMQKGRNCHLLVGIFVLIVLTVAHCQENKRRAVTEHQLMHDRGRSIQSLKRLIWLSSAIERLHTAQSRSLTSSFSSFKNNYGNDDEGNDESSFRFHPVMDSSVHRGALEMLLSDMYRPYIARENNYETKLNMPNTEH